MSRIAIEDLPVTAELTVEEQRRVVGGSGRKAAVPSRVGQSQTAASGMFDVASSGSVSVASSGAFSVASSGAFSVADAGGVQLAAAGTNRFA
ncbi:MAG: hypothetical protein AAF684_03325 [Pseudomonadota bacterium]